jgi:serine/threonine protein kinase
MSTLADRLKTYDNLTVALASLSDEQMATLIDDAQQVHSGIGGKGILLELDGTRVFVKKVPLTDLERLPENWLSTSNVFELPAFCHYGVGSPGFGAWRELFAHIQTTKWVIRGECPNFPLMYHWRVLPCAQAEPITSQQSEALEADVQYWEGSNAMRRILQAKHKASAQVLLFLEYVPFTLLKWLGEQLLNGKGAALHMIEQNLRDTNEFMHSHGFIHFDAHFENILTDGKQLYYSDFGLCSSTEFTLSEQELEFHREHYNYDQCGTLTNLLHCIVISVFDEDRWNLRLKEYLNGELGEELLKQYENGQRGQLSHELDHMETCRRFPSQRHTPIKSCSNCWKRFLVELFN